MVSWSLQYLTVDSGLMEGRTLCWQESVKEQNVHLMEDTEPRSKKELAARLASKTMPLATDLLQLGFTC